LIITDFDKEENRLYVDFTKFEGKYNILKADITIEVPFECRSKIKSENGKVSLSNLIGEQSIISENGPLKAENIEGNINIKTENSMIKISSVIGNITCETENSMIKISKTTGKIELSSENGMIKVSDSSGTLISESENGMVRVINSLFEKAVIRNENGTIHFETKNLEKGSIRLENENGKINLILPKEMNYDITAKNIFGSFQIGVDGSMEKTKEGDYRIIHIIKGSGHVKMELLNENGNIKVGNKLENNFADKIEEAVSSMLSNDNLIEKLDIGEKLINAVKESITDKNIEKAEEKIKAIIKEKQEKIEGKSEELSEKIKKQVNKVLGKAFEIISEKEKPDNDEIKKRSRMKILEMLQDGKITPEQAEKLLNALEKDYE